MLVHLVLGTRPGIAFTLGPLSKLVERPIMGYWNALKCLLRYVILRTERGPCCNDNCGMEIPEMYVDAHWASDCTTRKSTSCCIIIMSGAAVS